LYKSEKEVCKSLNYLEQVLQHQKLEILPNIITSLIENIFEIDSTLKGIFGNEPEKFRLLITAMSNKFSYLSIFIF